MKKKKFSNCADLLIRLCEILPATMASIHALYTPMLPQTNLQVSLCPTSFLSAPNTMADHGGLCGSFLKSMPPQAILRMAHGKLPEKKFTEPARGK